MSDFRPLPLDEAISLAATFAASSKHPIGDKTMASGQIAAKCFSGRQLADFLRSEEAGKFQVSGDEELLHVANELIRQDVVHEINDACGFCVAALGEESCALFRLIDDETQMYLKSRGTLASFTSPRYSPHIAVPGFSVVCDMQAKYFTGSVRTWRRVRAVLSVLGAQHAHDEPMGQIYFASVALFENEFGLPSVNMTVTGGQDKVIKIVSLRYGFPVLGFQSFHGRTGAMSEIEMFLEFSSEEIQNEWLLLLCQIGVVPQLESPSQDSGFTFRQELCSGFAQLLRCSDVAAAACERAFTDPSYTFDILGGIGQKSYLPSVTITVNHRDAAAGACVKRITIDIVACILTPRPDLVDVATQAPVGCKSAMELCDVMQEPQVKYILFFKSKEGAAKFIGSSESLLFTAMELNRYRQVVYLPDATQAQDSSVIKRRYLQMASMDRVPLKVVHDDAAGESYDYAAMFLQKSLWLEGILPKISISMPSHQLPRIIIPLKGKAVTFSDDTSTDLLISHNNKVIILRFINVVERDAFAFLFLSNSKVTEPSEFRLTGTFPNLSHSTVMPIERRASADHAARDDGRDAGAGDAAVHNDAEDKPRVSVGKRPSVIKMHKQGWLYKRGAFFKTWKRRYFVLRPGDLSYFASEQAATRGEKPLNTLILKDSDVGPCLEAHHGASELDPSNQCFFEVKIVTDKSRTLIMQACDEDERAEWLVALSKHKFESSNRSQVVALVNNYILTGADGGDLSMTDFELLDVVGVGAWGKVFRAKYKHAAPSDGTHKIYYAIKVMKKSVLTMQGIGKMVVQERRLMSELLHPFILTLHGHFSTPTKLYMVLKFAEGGDLSSRLKNEPDGYYNEDVARFIIAQLILAVEYMHGRGIMHRDLKAENILFDAEGFCLLADMGLAAYCPIARPPLCSHQGEPHSHTRVIVRKKTDKTMAKPLPAACTWSEHPVDITGSHPASDKYCRVMRGSFVGTPEYLAPEIIARQNYGPEADWWAIGILLYEMLVAQTPFVCGHAQGIYLKISLEEPNYPKRLSPAVVDLLKHLLKKDPAERFGGSVNGVDAIKAHPFFAGFNWRNLYLKRTRSPFAVKTDSRDDSGDGRGRKARDSVVADELSREQQAEFNMWDFAPTLDEEEEALETGGFRTMMEMHASTQ